MLKIVSERMFKIVKSNNSRLKTKHIIASLLTIMLIISNVQLFAYTNGAKQDNEIEQVEINEEQQIADNVASYERFVEVATRSMEKREIQQEKLPEEKAEIQEVAYKKIEEITISKNMDLTKRCGISKEDFKKLMKSLKKDTTKFFYKNSDLIYDLCEKYEINEIFFCGLIAAESGWNIVESHRVKCNYISMMSNGKLIKYSSTKSGLEAAAKLLHKKYLTPSGEYYNGKTLKGVQKMFCPDSDWVDLVYDCMKQIVK